LIQVCTELKDLTAESKCTFQIEVLESCTSPNCSKKVKGH